MEIIIVPIIVAGIAWAIWAVWKHYKACEKAGFDGSQH
jgi:hypothetical protein